VNRILAVAFVLGATPLLAQQPSAPSPPSAPDEAQVSPAIQERDVFNGHTQAAPRLDNAPIDPSLAGFIPIPGTSTMFKPYGNAKLDVIHDFAPAGEHDAFITSTIPVDNTFGADNTAISARPSRIGLDFRRPTRKGDLRVVYENDFYDFNTGKTQFDLRHLYGQVANLLAGFTFSTIVDPDALPDTLDFQGPGSLVFVSQAGVRYTRGFGQQKKHSLAVAIENPTSDIVYASAGPQPIGITPTSPLPDTHLRYRYDGDSGHVQIGTVFRSIGGFAANVGEKHVAGIGVSVTGSQKLGSDYILFQGAIGKGFARYIQDTSGLAGDVGVDASGKVVANGVGAFYVAYQHYWRDSFRSSLIYGRAEVDSEHKTLTTTFHDSTYASGNVIWNPKDSSLNVGVEFMWGQQMLATGQKGSASRVQVSFQYDLIK
jgi:hypothetical protein